MPNTTHPRPARTYRVIGGGTTIEISAADSEHAAILFACRYRLGEIREQGAIAGGFGFVFDRGPVVKVYPLVK